MRVFVAAVLLFGLLGSPDGDVKFDTDLAATAEVVPGTSMSYSVQVTAPFGATEVEVGGALPQGLAFAGGELCLPQSAAVLCSLGDLAPGETAAASFQVDTAPSLDKGLLNLTMWTNCEGCDAPMSTTASSQVIPQADLTLDEDGPSIIRAGRHSVYTMTVQNEGPSDSRGVVVVDTLPKPLAFVSGERCSAQGRQVRCEIDTIRPGGQHRFNVVVAAPDDFGDVHDVVNTVTVDAATPDPDSSGDSASLRSALEDTARLTINVTTSTGVIVPGAPFDYTVEVFNDGPSPARDVRIDNALPQGFGAADGCPEGICSFGTIPVGASRDMTLRTSVDPSSPAGTIADTARATCADCAKPALATSHTIVRPSADVAISAVVRPQRLGPGEQAVYTLTLTNRGPSTATGMTVIDELPEVLSAAPVPGCSLRLRELTCEVPSLAAGQSRTWVLDVRAPAEVEYPLTMLDRVSVSLPDSITDPQPDSEHASVAAELIVPESRWPGILVGVGLVALLAAAVVLVVRHRRSSRPEPPD